MSAEAELSRAFESYVQLSTRTKGDAKANKLTKEVKEQRDRAKNTIIEFMKQNKLYVYNANGVFVELKPKIKKQNITPDFLLQAYTEFHTQHMTYVEQCRTPEAVRQLGGEFIKFVTQAQEGNGAITYDLRVNKSKPTSAMLQEVFSN